MNMFAYCGNNPISRIDNGGALWKEVVQYVGQGIAQTFDNWSYIFAGVGQIGVYDGPVPALDAAAIAGTIVLGLAAVAVGTYEGVRCYQDNRAETKSKVETKTKISPKRQAFFTVNPFNFTPRGLRMEVRSGSYNGRIISWMVGKREVFRWDEDNRWGPHYHIMNHSGLHYQPGTPVPEPFN